MADRYYTRMQGAPRWREISKEDWVHAENMAGIMARGGQPQRKEFTAGGNDYRTWTDDGQDAPGWLVEALPRPSVATSQVSGGSHSPAPLESKGGAPVEFLASSLVSDPNLVGEHTSILKAWSPPTHFAIEIDGKQREYSKAAWMKAPIGEQMEVLWHCIVHGGFTAYRS